MKKKILIISVYPAPYRVELINKIAKQYAADVFFEHSNGDARDKSWFLAGKYELLDTETGKQKFKGAKEQIKQYELVIAYDYASITEISLIIRCILANVPYVLNCDGVMLTKHGNFFNKVIKRVIISKAKKCFASGKNAKTYFLQSGASDNDIIVHTFSTLHREDILMQPVLNKEVIREKLGLPSNSKIAIAVGRFIPLKRYGELIVAWKNMPSNYVLLLIGGGEEENSYNRIIEENEIGNVMIRGFHPKEELFEYYKSADVFVHPTSYDVWGLVLNEAMACGLPAVVSNHCVAGLELIKDGENGYLVKMGNDKEMCERVIQICENTKLHTQMAQNALQTIAPYTLDHMAETHIRVLKEILEVV